MVGFTKLQSFVLSEAVWWAAVICNQTTGNDAMIDDTVVQAERIIIDLIQTRCETTYVRAVDAFKLIKRTIFNNAEIESFLELTFPKNVPMIHETART